MDSESGAGGADSSEATRPPAEGGNVAREAVDAIEVHEHENDAEDDASDCVVGGGVALAAGSEAIRRSQARATCGAESLVAVPSKGSVFALHSDSATNATHVSATIAASAALMSPPTPTKASE